MRDAVEAAILSAINGLFIAPDMWGSAMHAPELIDSAVDKLHSCQPLNQSYEALSVVINDSYHDLQLWYERINESHVGRDALMVIADMATTHRQIERGLDAALCVASAIFARCRGMIDSAEYPRIVPRALDGLQITDLDQITVSTYRRILAVEPWLGWTERLRAQQQRSDASLRSGDVIAVLSSRTPQAPREINPRLRRRLVRAVERAARKSIRRSVAMYGRLDRVAELRTFLASVRGNRKPLVIRGSRFDYRLLMHPSSLITGTAVGNTGVSPVGTTILNKSGERLCSACVYFNDTPLLDHVLSMMLNVANPETELDVLRAMNVFDARCEFYDDPVLPALKGLLDPLDAPTLVDSIMLHDRTIYDPDQINANETVRHNSGRLVWKAFRTVMRTSAARMETQRLGAQHRLEDYLLGDPAAMAVLRARRAHAMG